MGLAKTVVARLDDWLQKICPQDIVVKFNTEFTPEK